MNRLGGAVGCLLLLSCSKVPIVDIQAGFTLADASWFAEEDTLFVFYEVQAEQGIGEESVIEVTYTTDDERVDWTPLSELPSVHTHVPVDCGTTALCGSASFHVPIQPRRVRVRLRYHRDGELSLVADTAFNVVDEGPAHSHRSLLVYGVFDEANERVQWRGRHQFPTLRNQQVEDLGLRRDFTVSDQAFGNEDVPLATGTNPYGYGVTCPSSFVATGFAELATNERARFEPELLPLGASDVSTVCANATVTDATGTFTTGAIARKNPEVHPAFDVLRSPTHDATALRFFLGPCDRTISAEHEAMQRQRLLLGNIPTLCTDDWQQPGFVEGLVVTFREAVESQRILGNDMVLVVALNQDEAGVQDAVESALAQVVPDERLRSTPRLAGAFVLDSTARGLSRDELSPVTLWCPSTLPTSELPDVSSRTCAVAPDEPDLVLGPFSFGALPILPTRDQYLDFIDTYSDGQAGSVQSLTFRTPEFATISDHVALGDFGVATFLNNERISAGRNDAFSYCTGEELMPFVFRSEFMQSDEFLQLIDDCDELGLSPDTCAAAGLGLASIEGLPDWHNVFGERSYELGLFWEFPFLLRMEYELVTAGSVSAFGLSVPFGLASPAEAYYGAETWSLDEFPLGPYLTQCSRFCDHPTFDSAGVYHVTDPFRSTYAHACYLPRYPAPGDSGFPLDP